MPDTDTARDRLIDATRGLLWERGYTAASPRAILDRAGVGQGSMYHHFRNKEDLAAAAFRANAEDTYRRAEAALRGDGRPLDRLVAYLEVSRDVLKGCPVGRMAGDQDVLDAASLHVVLTETFERLRALVSEVVTAAAIDGDLSSCRPGDADAAAALTDTVLAVVQGGYVLARAAGDAAPFERAARGAVALLTTSPTN